MKRTLLLALFSLSLVSCVQPPATLPAIVDLPSILGVVYDSVGERIEGTQSFSSIQGTYSVVFDGDSNSGTFEFAYTNFDSPSLCPYLQNCVCTGTFAGTYTSTSQPMTTSSTPTSNGTNGIYNPLNPSSSTSTTSVNTPSGVTVVYLALTPGATNNLPAPCPAASNRTIEIQINNDSTIVLTDLGKDFSFTPRQAN